VVGAALGLSLAAPPGPMNAVIAEESVLRGWRAGFAAGLGAMSADACFFVLALLGVVAVVQDAPTVRAVMVGVGGLLMCYFAYGAARGASQPLTTAGGSDGKGFRKAFALALTNPYQIIWWLTAGVGLLDPTAVHLFGHTLASGGGPVTIVGFFGGILLWITGFPAALRAAGRKVDRFGAVVAYLSALVLAGFGLSFLWSAATALA